MESRNQPTCLVVGCGKECCKSGLSNLFSSNPHKLHSGNNFYMIDTNEKLKPDETINFFELSNDRKFKAVFTEYCSLFKGENFQLQAFIAKCRTILDTDGVLIIKGQIPDQREREEFAKKGLNFVFENKETWAIYFKGNQNNFDLSKYSAETQKLIKESGYQSKPVLGQAPATK